MTSFDFGHNEGFVMHSSLKTMRVMAWSGLDLGQKDFLEDDKKRTRYPERYGGKVRYFLQKLYCSLCQIYIASYSVDG